MRSLHSDGLAEHARDRLWDRAPRCWWSSLQHIGVSLRPSGQLSGAAAVWCEPAPPADQGAATPPADQGAATPPADQGAATPPADQGAATPPADQGAATPPADQGGGGGSGEN